MSFFSFSLFQLQRKRKISPLTSIQPLFHITSGSEQPFSNILATTATKPLESSHSTKPDSNHCMWLHLVASCMYCNSISQKEPACNKKCIQLAVALIIDVTELYLVITSSKNMIWLFRPRSAYTLHTYLTFSFHFYCLSPLLISASSYSSYDREQEHRIQIYA